MILRPFTLIAGLLFVLSGAFMFVVKHQSQALDDQLSDINEAATHDEQNIRVLQAQWALEADPARLAALAAQFTGLQPMKPAQLVTLAALGASLPAPGARPPGGNPEDPVPAMPEIAAAPAPAVAVAAAVPAPVAAVPAAPPVRTAAATPAAAPQPEVRHNETRPVAPEHLAAAASPAQVAPVHHHSTPERLAGTVPVHHVVPPPREGRSSVYLADASASAPMPAPIHAPARAVPMGAQFVPVRAVAPPPPPATGGSLLGMAQGGSQ